MKIQYWVAQSETFIRGDQRFLENFDLHNCMMGVQLDRTNNSVTQKVYISFEVSSYSHSRVTLNKPIFMSSHTEMKWRDRRNALH